MAPAVPFPSSLLCPTRPRTPSLLVFLSAVSLPPPPLKPIPKPDKPTVIPRFTLEDSIVLERGINGFKQGIQKNMETWAFGPRRLCPRGGLSLRGTMGRQPNPSHHPHTLALHPLCRPYLPLGAAPAGHPCSPCCWPEEGARGFQPTRGKGKEEGKERRKKGRREENSRVFVIIFVLFMGNL